MRKEFIPYEQALKLVELGFDVSEIMGVLTLTENPSSAYSAILWQQAFRFFREKYSMFHAVKIKPKDKGAFYAGYVHTPTSAFGESVGSNYNTYEEAELACLNKLIELIETI